MTAVARQAEAVAGLLLCCWPVTALLVGVWVAAAIRSARAAGPSLTRLARLCLLPAGLTGAILLFGVALGGGLRGGSDSALFAEVVLGGLLLAHLPFGIGLARRAGERSPVVVASGVAWFSVSACSALVTWTSVTRSWL